MQLSMGFDGQEQAIIKLFKASFCASDGHVEGARIGDLVRQLLADTASDDIHVGTASEPDRLLGASVFTRLTYEQDDREIFVLGPVAVATDRQRQGIGQAMLNHALDSLRRFGVDIVLTYGDPRYYGRLGFVPVSEQDAAAPFKLQHPHGWQGLSLTGHPWIPLRGRSLCVGAFNDPVFW